MRVTISFYPLPDRWGKTARYGFNGRVEGYLKRKIRKFFPHAHTLNQKVFERYEKCPEGYSCRILRYAFEDASLKPDKDVWVEL